MHVFSPVISFSYPTVATTFTLAPELEKNSKRQLRESIRYNAGELKEVVEMVIPEEKEDIRQDKLIYLLIKIYMFM